MGRPKTVGDRTALAGGVGVYFRTRGIYLVPFEDVPLKSQAALRVAPARSGQARNVRAARAMKSTAWR